jgi:ubiquinone/menaquinone biosynthesis C-methylase UbiE
MALGANRRMILQFMLQDISRVVGFGAWGCLVTVVVAHVHRAFLYGISEWDIGVRAAADVGGARDRCPVRARSRAVAGSARFASRAGVRLAPQRRRAIARISGRVSKTWYRTKLKGGCDTTDASFSTSWRNSRVTRRASRTSGSTAAHCLSAETGAPWQPNNGPFIGKGHSQNPEGRQMLRRPHRVRPGRGSSLDRDAVGTAHSVGVPVKAFMAETTGGYTNEIPYIAYFHPYLAPSLLDWVAASAGQQPVSIDRPFRLLEIACGKGITTVMLAVCYPEATFIGIDISAKHIEYGQHTAADIGVANVEFVCAGVDELLAPEFNWEPFDYIVCHGLMSSVTPEVRAATYRAIARLLRPGGILYVSYNCLPGQSHLMPVRKVLSSLTDATAPGFERIDHGIDLLEKLLAAGAAALTTGDGTAEAIRQLRSNDRSYLVHEYLNACWEPLWYDEVAASLGAIGMSYAGSTKTTRNITELCMTQEQIDFLNGQPNHDQRQQLQDIMLDERFRRDVWARAPRVPVPRASEGPAQWLRLGLVESPAQLPTELAVPVGKAVFDGPHVEAMIRRIGREGPTLAALCAAIPERTVAACERIARILVATGLVHTLARCYEKVDESVAADPATRWEMSSEANRFIVEHSRERRGLRFLASPVLGNAVPLKAVDGVVLAAIIEAGIDDAADHARGELRARGRELLFNGTVLVPGPDEDQALEEARARFASGRLLQWWRLGILRPRTA